MTKQPEALRLADALECAAFLHLVERDMIAAELRRLHEVNQELLGALKELCDVTDTNDYNEAAFFKAEAAIAKATGEQL